MYIQVSHRLRKEIMVCQTTATELISEAKAQKSDLLLWFIFCFIYWFIETPGSNRCRVQ